MGTQTKTKNNKEHKARHMQEIRDAINTYSNLYVFSYENMRSTKFINVRKYFHNDNNNKDSIMNDEDDSMSCSNSSRLFLGKNKLIQIALGRTIEDEHDINLHEVSSKYITGSIGLLCTSKSKSEIEHYFHSINEDDYARVGQYPISQNIIITNQDIKKFQTTMVDLFRKLGLPVEVNNGILKLIGGREEYVLVKAGKNVMLSVETCKLLHLFEIKVAKFRLTLLCRWDKNGDIEEY